MEHFVGHFVVSFLTLKVDRFYCSQHGLFGSFWEDSVSEGRSQSCPFAQIILVWVDYRIFRVTLRLLKQAPCNLEASSHFNVVQIRS